MTTNHRSLAPDVSLDKFYINIFNLTLYQPLESSLQIFTLTPIATKYVIIYFAEYHPPGTLIIITLPLTTHPIPNQKIAFELMTSKFLRLKRRQITPKLLTALD